MLEKDIRKLKETIKDKLANEERASGISPESTELDAAIESNIGLSDAAEGELNTIESKKYAEKQREQQRK